VAYRRQIQFWMTSFNISDAQREIRDRATWLWGRGVRSVRAFDITKPLHLLVVGALLGSICAPVASWLYDQSRYALSDGVRAVAERPSPTLKSKIKYDAGKKANVFNADGANKEKAESRDRLAASLGGSGKRSNQLYTATMPDDATQGVEVHDNVNDVSIKFVPRMGLIDGRGADGRVVYPLKDSAGHLIFTPKANGVKEDIVLESAPQSDAVEYQYQLSMPTYVEARLDDTGNIGFYTATPELFGNISYGTDKDREIVDKARNKGQKNYLMFKIPAPTVRETGSRTRVQARFGLAGNTLTVSTTGLAKAHYPLSIDPTFLITTTADFVLGAIDDNIDLTTADQVTRATLSGGSTPDWAPDTTISMTNGNYAFGLVAYNSALYMVGGANDESAGTGNVATNKVRFIKLNSDGTANGAWTAAANNMGTARQGLVAFGYNGYLYAAGGVSDAGTPINTVEFAQITSTGNIGVWHNTAHLNSARGFPAGAVYQGVLYAMGGSSTGLNAGLLSTTEYARVNGNGSLGHCTDAVDPTYLSNCTWDSGTTLSAAARNRLIGGAYNGWVYVTGGRTATPAVLNTVEAAPINSDGSLGTWTTTGMTAFPSGRRDHGMGLQNGHIYVYGGCSSATFGCPSFLADTEYAPINADGTIGQWQSSVSYNTTNSPRTLPGSAVYNNFLYFVGGCATENANGTDCSGFRVGTFSTGFDTPGRFDQGESTSGTAPYSGQSTVSREGARSVAMNGYVYYISGCSDPGCGRYDPTVEYASVSNDGTLGNFSTTTALPVGTGSAGRLGHTVVSYNNKMYVIGGTERPLYPTVSSVTPTTVGTAATAHNIAMPAAASTGDLLLVLLTTSGNNTVTTPAGWTSIATAQNAGTSMRASVFAKISVGTEGGTNVGFTTSGNATAAAQTYRVPNGQWSGTLATGVNASTAAVSNATTTPNPASLTPSWGSANNLWIAYAGGLGYTSVTTYPTNYSNGVHTTTGTGGTNSSTSSAINYIEAAAEDPGTFTEANSVAEVAYTVAVRPPATADIYPTAILSATQNSDGTLGAWGTETNGLPVARDWATSAVWHNFIYVLGGRDATTVYGTVYYAQIGAGGAIGTWNTATTGITARWGHSGGIWGNWLYVIGGQTTTGGTYIGTTAALHAMQQLTINTSTGNITAAAADFATNTTRRFADGFVHNGYIYQFGGNLSSATAARVDISWTSLNPVTGNPGTLVTTNIGNSPDQTVGMSTARSQAAAVATGGYFYVLGGCTSVIANASFRACSATVPLANTSELYVPNNGGTGQTGAFSSSTALSSARADHSSVAYNGKLYVLGGCTAYSSGTCSTNVTTVQSADINPDGSLGGSWTTQTSLPTERSLLQAAAYNGYMYVVGGRSNSSAQTNTVWYTTIGNTGALGASWTVSANTLGTARRAFGMAITRGYIYVAGGIGAGGRLNDVVYATLDQFSGAVSAWTTTTSFTTARTGFGFVSYNGRLYVSGGYSGSAALSDTQYALINSTDGSVGSWTNTTDASRGFDVGQMIGANGYMYFIGTNGDGTEVEYADINANGTLGTMHRSANTMAAAHFHGAAAWFDGVFYVTGACTVNASDDCNAAPTTSSERAGQQAIARTGHYSKLFDTQVDTAPTQLVVGGTISGPGSAVEFKFETASTTDTVLGIPQLIRPVVFGNFYNVQALNSSGTLVGQAFQYLYVITLDDSRSGTFPDVPNTDTGFANTSVQDVTLYYHANPARRLRHGASFTNSGCNPTAADGCILDTAP
jgi:hypothetical protein